MGKSIVGDKLYLKLRRVLFNRKTKGSRAAWSEQQLGRRELITKALKVVRGADHIGEGNLHNEYRDSYCVIGLLASAAGATDGWLDSVDSAADYRSEGLYDFVERHYGLAAQQTRDLMHLNDHAQSQVERRVAVLAELHAIRRRVGRAPTGWEWTDG